MTEPSSPSSSSLSPADSGQVTAPIRPGVQGHGPVRSKAFVLYEGRETPHRSCGIALAEALDRPTMAYQSLRRGGITGTGTCGAIMAGQLLLGELLGDADPTGKVTPALRQAIENYQRRVERELDRGESADLICNNMTAPHGPFQGEARHHFCTNVVAQVAQLVDEILRDAGQTVQPKAVLLANGQTLDPQAVAFVASPTLAQTK